MRRGNKEDMNPWLAKVGVEDGPTEGVAFEINTSPLSRPESPSVVSSILQGPPSSLEVSAQGREQWTAGDVASDAGHLPNAQGAYNDSDFLSMR